jgi:hypothetical protein
LFLPKKNVNYRKNDTWQVCYFNTGWARDGWDVRVKLIKDMCEKYELKFNELKASVMNEHRTTENLLATGALVLFLMIGCNTSFSHWEKIFSF